jgi:hypothetical protein
LLRSLQPALSPPILEGLRRACRLRSHWAALVEQHRRWTRTRGGVARSTTRSLPGSRSRYDLAGVARPQPLSSSPLLSGGRWRSDRSPASGGCPRTGTCRRSAARRLRHAGESGKAMKLVGLKLRYWQGPASSGGFGRNSWACHKHPEPTTGIRALASPQGTRGPGRGCKCPQGTTDDPRSRLSQR